MTTSTSFRSRRPSSGSPWGHCRRERWRSPSTTAPATWPRTAVPVLRDLALPAAVFLATGPMGSDKKTSLTDRLWLAMAHTTATEVDLAALGLGARSLDGTASRGTVYAAAVAGLKDLPDAQRVAVLDGVPFAALGHRDGGDGGPFRMLSWDEAREMASDGLVTLYPHTGLTHPILARCSDDEVEPGDHGFVRDVAA